MRRRLLFPIVAILVAGLAAGGMRAVRDDPVAPLVGRVVPTAVPTDPREPSPPGGLGNTRGDLERVYGTPTGLRGTMIAYRNGTYAATYAGGRAQAVLLSFDSIADGGRPTLEAARQRAQRLIPLDSIFIGTLRAGPDRIADVYRSARLGALLDMPHRSAASGQFAVVYEIDAASTVRMVLLTASALPTN